MKRNNDHNNNTIINLDSMGEKNLVNSRYDKALSIIFYVSLL